VGLLNLADVLPVNLIEDYIQHLKPTDTPVQRPTVYGRIYVIAVIIRILLIFVTTDNEVSLFAIDGSYLRTSLKTWVLLPPGHHLIAKITQKDTTKGIADGLHLSSKPTINVLRIEYDSVVRHKPSLSGLKRLG